MTESPQFRTVLRGADPEQVAEAMKELQTSLVVSRRAAADRTIELSRLQEEHQSLQAELATAQHRLAELERSGASGHPVAGGSSGGSGGGHSYGDLGARIGSMLSLAEEEATQIRAAAETEAAERRDQAVRALAAELAAEEARLDDTKARTAALGDELAQLRGRAEEEHGRMREHAVQEADEIRQQARADAETLHRQAEEQRVSAVAHRDQVHEHLGQIAALIGGVLGARPGAAGPGDSDAQAAGGAPTLDDVAPAHRRDAATEGQDPPHDAPATPVAEDHRESDRTNDPDATVPDVTRPDDHGHEAGPDGSTGSTGSTEEPGATEQDEPRDQGHEERAEERADERDDHLFASRSSDATQVIEPVRAQAAQSRRSQPTRGRESRRQYADAGDSFVGEPWLEDDGSPAR